MQGDTLNLHTPWSSGVGFKGQILKLFNPMAREINENQEMDYIMKYNMPFCKVKSNYK